MLNKNIFCNYPDAMTLAQFAECMGISTKLASRIIHEGKVFARKVGREYRISKSSVMEYVRGERKRKKESCVVNVTSNPQHWTLNTSCDIVSGTKINKEVG